MNRDHTKLTLNRWTPQSGETRTLITEEDPYWINEERYAAPIFLGDGEQFLWLSERDGFMHLYLYTAEGELVRQLTQGDWMIDSSAWNLLTPGRPVHVDPAGEWAYFITTRSQPAGAADRPRQHRHRRAGAGLAGAGIPSLRPVG